VSLSHTHEHAVAVAVALERDEPLSPGSLDAPFP
jgi:hypothetical protein